MDDPVLLKAALSVSVPLWIQELSPLSHEERLEIGLECACGLTQKGDNILYKSQRAGETAHAFNALAKGLACLSFQPGGVKFAGLHFEAQP